MSERGGKTRGKPNFFCFFVLMFVLFLKEFCQYHFSKNIFCTRNKYLLFSFNAQLKLNPGIPQLPKEEICLLKCLLSVKVELEPGSWFGRFKLRFFPPKFSPSFLILFIKVYLEVQSYCGSSVLLGEVKRTSDRKIFKIFFFSSKNQ